MRGYDHCQALFLDDPERMLFTFEFRAVSTEFSMLIVRALALPYLNFLMAGEWLLIR